LSFNIGLSPHETIVRFFLLTSLSFSLGISNTHLNLESIRSSDFFKIKNLLTTASISEMFGGAKIVCTINLCLLFSFGS
uniref:Uncharacterized protein n=1 Tax=Sphenodon punctatus TaxID=8508 RepID=A0A8D0L2S9_SPHPU